MGVKIRIEPLGNANEWAENWTFFGPIFADAFMTLAMLESTLAFAWRVVSS